MPQNPETRLQKMIVAALKAEGAYAVKMHGNVYRRGLPDIMGCHRGLFFGFEVKVPGREDTVTAIQQATLDDIGKAGGIAAVVTSIAETLDVLHEVDGGA